MRRSQDHFGRRAKKEGYPARSVYKLQEIDRRLNLFTQGQRVLELGAAPGSWTMYASERIGDKGLVVSVDLQPLGVALPSNTKFIQADIFAIDIQVLMSENPHFDVVISDMAPSTSGSRHRDQYLSYELFMRALFIADAVLASSGSFVGKLFQGPEFSQARAALAAAFSTTRILKPKASRKESYELFMVGRQRKPDLRPKESL